MNDKIKNYWILINLTWRYSSHFNVMLFQEISYLLPITFHTLSAFFNNYIQGVFLGIAK